MRAGDVPSLVEIVERLPLRSAAPVLTDPLQLILWENMGYLIDDERRGVLFEEFANTVGLDAAAVAAADWALLFAIAKRGGMRPEVRVERWRTIAAIVLSDCGGDLDGALRRASPGEARALLKRFPTIGDPGADRILLFAGLAARPCLDSNGLRALARLGFFAEQGAYAASYRLAIDVLVAQGRPDRDWLVDAYVALREHGKALCKRGVPLCPACPLDEVCGHAVVRAL